MNGKFFTLVVFASLAGCSSAIWPFLITWKLSDADIATSKEIIRYEEAAISAKAAGYGLIFEVVQDNLYTLIENCDSPAEKNSAKLAEAVLNLKKGFNYTLDALQLTPEKLSSDIIESIRSASFAGFDAAGELLTQALKLAAIGNYSSNRADLQALEAKVRNQFILVQNNTSAEVTSNDNNDDTEISTVIGQTTALASVSLSNAVTAIFNAIKYYASLVTSGRANVDSAIVITGFKSQGVAQATAELEYKFSTMKAFFLHSKVNGTSLSALLVVKYIQTVSWHKYVAETGAIFDTISGNVAAVDLGLGDAGESDYSLRNIQADFALAKLVAGFNTILSAVEYLHPKASAAAAIVRNTFTQISPDLIDTIFSTIDDVKAVGANHTESQRVVEDREAKVLSFINVYISNYYTLLANGSNLDTESAAKFSAIKELAESKLKTFVSSIFSAISRYADVLNAGAATPDDYNSIIESQKTANQALRFYTGCSAAAITVVVDAEQ